MDFVSTAGWVLFTVGAGAVSYSAPSLAGWYELPLPFGLTNDVVVAFGAAGSGMVSAVILSSLFPSNENGNEGEPDGQ